MKNWNKLGRAAALAMLVSLGACGGGGGGEDAAAPGTPPAPPSALMSFEPAAVTATFVADGQTQYRTVIAPVVATVKDVQEVRYIVFLLDQPVLNERPMEVLALGNDRYRIELSPRTGLAAGHYTGKITVLLCYDDQCAGRHPASGAELPYDITVTASTQLTVTVNGVAVPGVGADSVVRVRSGDAVRVTSTQPVTWSEAMSGARARDRVATDTTWAATMEKSGSFIGSFELSMVTLGAPKAQIGFRFAVE